MKIKRAIVLPDLQLPFTDHTSLKPLEQYMKSQKWDFLIYMGDFLDYFCISKFNEGKPGAIEGHTIMKELKQGKGLLEKHIDIVRKNNPKCRVIYLEGNHEYRAYDWVKRFPHLKGLIEPENVLEFKKNKVEYIRSWSEGETFNIGKAFFTHGDYTNIHHAKKMVEAYEENIFYGHCLSEDSEILTTRGWLGLSEINEEDTCLTMNKSTELLEWQKINKKFVYDAPDEMIRIKSGSFDLLVDDSHGLVGQAIGTKKTHYFKAKDLIEKGGQWKFKVSGKTAGQNKDIPISDDMLKLLAWIFTEGTIYHIGHTPYIEISQSKERFIEEIKELLHRLSLPYSLKERTGSKISKLKAFRFRFGVDVCRELLEYIPREKSLPEWFWSLSDRQFELFVDEYIKGDGSVYTGKYKNQRMIYTNDKEWVDALQARLFMCGYKTSVFWRNGGLSGNKPCAQINIFKREWSQFGRQHVSKEKYSGKMWCVNVNNGTIVVRRNGKICVTQNTHDLNSFNKTARGTGKTKVGQSLGTLCHYPKDIDYTKGKAKNWNQAFGVFYFLPNEFFNYYVIRIFHGAFVSPEGDYYDY